MLETCTFMGCWFWIFCVQNFLKSVQHRVQISIVTVPSRLVFWMPLSSKSRCVILGMLVMFFVAKMVVKMSSQSEFGCYYSTSKWVVLPGLVLYTLILPWILAACWERSSTLARWVSVSIQPCRCCEMRFHVTLHDATRSLYQSLLQEFALVHMEILQHLRWRGSAW